MGKGNVLHLPLFMVCVISLMKASCLATSFNTTTSSTHDDESSLLALKAHIMNPNTSLNWSEGTPFCSWTGVSCSQRHPFRVTALNLSYIGLQGTIPEEIGNLSFLSYLNIRNNSFSGTIPETIESLRRLRVVIMGSNRFIGRIPPTLGRLTELETLSLSDNQLTGTIPSTIFNISSLLEIRLSMNQFSGSLPQDIGHYLPNLQDLRLSRNQLNGDINPLITSLSSSCPQLNTLLLSFNNFSGSIPAQIGNLSQLQTLALARINLTGTIPTSVTNLSNLEQLDLGDNSLEGTIPSQIGQLSNLYWLSFQQNKLNGEIPSSLFNLSNLQILQVGLNNLSGEIPPTIGTSLPYLQVLFLPTNRLHGTIPSSISNLSMLSQLDLRENSFTGHIPMTLGNLHQLQVISLGQNWFTNNLSIPEQDFITPLTRCINLRAIQFETNPLITGELPKSLNGYSNLSSTFVRLIAHSCGISGEIPIEIGNLSSLIWLSIENNTLTGGIPSTLGSLTNLQFLSLWGNMLQGSIPYSLCGMKSLYLLYLWGNKLFGDIPSCFGNLTSLGELYLSDNAFNSSIPSSLWFNTGIQKMNLSNNFFFGNLSRDMGNMRGMSELDLSRNQLSGDIPNSIDQLQSLVFLSLSNNKIHGHIPETLASLKELRYMDLSYNNLSGSIPTTLETLVNLDYLNVSFNELSGEIPNTGPFENFTDEDFIGNKDLCGIARFKVEACKVDVHKSSSKSRLLKYILPPVVAFSIVVAVVVLIFVMRYRGRKSSSLSDQPLGFLQERISYYDILRATNNLDEGTLIGRGSCGSVYNGQFSGTMIAAVKVFNLGMQGALKSFDTECQIMRSIRHRNLVKVITSCSNDDFKALVMEYMPGGNLDRWLYSTEFSLNISQRFEIMTDVASAVEYLHHGYSAPIIHCDLKPGNILLDSDMVARVGDFGIAKLLISGQTSPQTKTLGTIGYMAPEYGSEGLVSTMADVYSYGIVLMETFIRRKPTDEMFSGEVTMKRWVSEHFHDSLMQIVDADLVNVEEENAIIKHENCLTLVIGLALECTTEVPEERPNMKDVLVKIKKIKDQL